MTDRELRLRQRIDELTDRLDAEKAKVSALRQKRALRRCVFCGAWCQGRACVAHADLLDGIIA